MGVSTNVDCEVRALPPTPRGSGFPVAQAFGQGVVSMDASGDPAGVSLRLPYSYAVVPLWVSAKTTELGNSKHIAVSWETSMVGRVSGREIVLDHTMFTPFATQAASWSGGWGNAGIWHVPPMIYIPDEEVQAIHQVQALCPNTNLYELSAACYALLFDPEDMRRVAGSFVSLMHLRG